MQGQSGLPVKILLLISLAQGFCLLVLHQSIEFKFWPHTQPQWLFCLYAMVLTGPTLSLLGMVKHKEIKFIKCIMPFTLLCGGIGGYVGYQATPMEYIRYGSLLSILVATLSIASFKVLMYAQQYMSGRAFNYSHLFEWSWRNFLTLCLSLLFALCFWGILMLWAGLFKAIKINFFYDLFTERWFYYPAVSLAHGFGIVIFRSQSKVIDAIKTLQQVLMKYLLIVLVIVSMLFLAALPVSGLAPLWESGGSFLILWMQALVLFFINAVYQDDPTQRPYNIIAHRFIYAGVILLPIYSAISFYGLSLRVEQYGWSVMRCWALLIWLLLALFSLGYFWGVARLRDNWIKLVSKINVGMGLVVLFFMLLVNTPLLDFRKITVQSQLHRLNLESKNPEELDVRYFRQELARPGYEALQALKDQYANTHPLLVAKINQLYSKAGDNNLGISQEDFFSSMAVIDGDLPHSLKEYIYKEFSENAWMISRAKGFAMLAIDANQDGSMEFLMLSENELSIDLHLYALKKDEWVKHNLNTYSRQNKIKTVLAAFKSEQVELATPEWQDLKIGENSYKIMPAK